MRSLTLKQSGSICLALLSQHGTHGIQGERVMSLTAMPGRYGSTACESHFAQLKQFTKSTITNQPATGLRKTSASARIAKIIGEHIPAHRVFDKLRIFSRLIHMPARGPERAALPPFLLR